MNEEQIKEFEKQDSENEKALGWWWRVYHQLKEDQAKLHQNFRTEHNLTDSCLQGIADWRWNKNREK